VIMNIKMFGFDCAPLKLGMVRFILRETGKWN